MKIETKPLTRTILNITVTLTPNFLWSKKFSNQSEPFWVIVDNEKEIIHYEQFLLLPKQNERIKTRETVLTFAVPFDIEPGKRKAHLESVYTVSIISERWIGNEISESFYLADIEVPDDQDVKTDLLNIYPLPLSVLQDKDYEKVFSDSFKFFNPIQTQIFYSVYHTDENLLIGAPTGSGKTVIAELAMLRLFKKNPTGKIIYIAPLKQKQKEDKEKYGNMGNMLKTDKAKKQQNIIRTSDQSFKLLLNMIMGIQIAVQSIPNFHIKSQENLNKYLTNMLYSIQTINFDKKKEEVFILKEFAGIIFNNISIIISLKH